VTQLSVLDYYPDPSGRTAMRLPEGDMRRRAFLCGAGAMLAGAHAVEAQQMGKMYRIGYLANGNPTTSGPFVDAFRQGLREFGWAEGQNVSIEYRWADGSLELLPALALDLLKAPLDVIVLAGGPAVRAARQATRTVPIVSAIMSDPVAAGFATSLARPGGNITGSGVEFDALATKQLQMLKEMAPKAAQVAILFDRATINDVLVKSIETAARALGLKGRVFETRDVRDIESAFQTARAERLDAVYVSPSPTFSRHRGRLAELGVNHRLPAIYEDKSYVEAGGLISYGPSFLDLHRRAANYVDRIFKAAKAGDLPIEQPTKFELAINLKAAKAIGLTIPPSLLARADQIIE
jgi:putative ABC transport system substrate-binding protein